MEDCGALDRALAESDVVIHCAGPFDYLPLNPLRAAIKAKVNYIDISEDREFAQRVKELSPEIRSAGNTVMNGISVVPAMEALFIELMRPCLGKVTSIRTFAAPDTRRHRGKAMFHTMLMGVGRPFEQPRNGEMVRVHGWSQQEWVDFPPPIGKRLTYLVLEMADLDVLPALFGVETVEFKAGCEFPLANRILGWAATIRASTGFPNWERMTPLIRAFSWFVGRFGKDQGGVIFELGGGSGEPVVTYRVAVVADKDGGRIPSALAGIAVAELLDGRLHGCGIVPVHSWLTPQRFLAGLAERGLSVWWQPPGEVDWGLLSLSELQRRTGADYATGHAGGGK
jgi:hypothetical protein